MSSDIDSDKSVDEYLNKDIDRLLEKYDGKSKDFEKYFAILLGVSLFVLLFMLYPYVSNQILKQSYSEESKNIENQKNELNSTLNPLQEAVYKMNNLEKDISNGPNELREYIENISNENASIVQGSIINNNMDNNIVAQSFQQSFQQSNSEFSRNPQHNNYECSFLIPSVNDSSKSKQWIECNIIQEVKEQLNGYSNRLNNSIIQPLREISDLNINKTIDFNVLNTELKKLNATLFEEFEKPLPSGALMQKKAGSV